ncbi:MAG: hypothetical protein AAB787_01685 [Patescibacteria group bacterium]
MKFAIGDLLKHRGSGERCIVSGNGQWPDGKDYYVLSLGIDASQVKKIEIDRAEVIFELYTNA